MKRSLFALAFALFMLSSLACGSDETPQSNETKTVARIIARMATASLSFKYQQASQEVISTLNSADYFVFGVIIDKDKNVVASYFRADANAEKEKLLAGVVGAIPQDKSETMRVDGELILAITPVKFQSEVLGYAVVARAAR